MTDPAEQSAEVRTAAHRLKRVLRPLMSALALAFVLWAFRDLAKRWDSNAVHVHWGLVAASLVPLVIGGVVLAAAWRYLIARLACRSVAFGPSVALHAESQLARYLPGKVGIPVVRMAGAGGIGVPAKVAGSSVLIELTSYVAVGGVIGLGLVTAFRNGDVSELLGRYAPLAVPALAVIIALLVFVDRARCPARIRRVLGFEGEGPLAPRSLPFMHVVYWLTWAAHGVLVTSAVGADASGARAAAGVFVLAPIVGFLALAAPAGAGVREAALSIGLVPVVGPAPALSALLLSRGMTLVADVVVWLVLRPMRARSTASQ